MENEFVELLLLSLAGITLHYLSSWQTLIQKNKLKEFRVINEVPGFLLSVVTVVVVVYVREDIKTFYVVTPFGAVLLGYFSQSIFKKLIEAKSPVKLPDPKDPEDANSVRQN